MKQDRESLHVFSPQRAVMRFALALLAGVGAAVLTPGSLPWTLRLMLAWDVAAGALLVMSWAILLSADDDATERRAGTEDLYYRGEGEGGLVFPGTERPDDSDFAYYAFTLGMCFQVSDVQITSRYIRRSSLVHALISFLFNTTIVALALNLVSRLLDG